MQMNIDEFRKLYPRSIPKRSWFEQKQSPTTKTELPEATLQEYANEAITLRRWQYIRFPDAILGWIKRNSPPWVAMSFFRQVGGRLPDNLVMVQVAPGLFLSAKLELKTRDKRGRPVGKTRGKQKRYAEAESWYIARSPEEINSALDKINEAAEKIKKCLI